MVSTEFASITIALGLAYFFLFFHEVKWVRLSGCFAVIIISIGYGVIADTLPLFILMMINMLIGLLKLTFETGDLINTIRGP